MLMTEVKSPKNLRAGLKKLLGLDLLIYLDRAYIFGRFCFSLHIRFVPHFALMFIEL